MKTLSIDVKKTYFAKTRRFNYMASLRLEGYQSRPEDATYELPSREKVLRRYRKVEP